MIDDKTKKQLDAIKKRILTLAHDRRQLELTTIIIILFVGLACVHYPLTTNITETRQRHDHMKEYIDVSNDLNRIESRQRAYIDQVIGEDADINWWVERFLEGLRTTRLRLKNLEHTSPKANYSRVKPLVVKMEIEGDFLNISNFLRWVEGQVPTAIVSSIRIQRKPEWLLGNLELSMFATKKKKKKKAKEAKPEKTDES